MIFKWIKKKFEEALWKEIEKDLEKEEEATRALINYIVVCPEMLEFLSKKKGAINLNGTTVYDGVLFKGSSFVEPYRMIVKGHKDQIIHVANVGTEWRNYDN